MFTSQCLPVCTRGGGSTMWPPKKRPKRSLSHLSGSNLVSTECAGADSGPTSRGGDVCSYHTRSVGLRGRVRYHLRRMRSLAAGDLRGWYFGQRPQCQHCHLCWKRPCSTNARLCMYPRDCQYWSCKGVLCRAHGPESGVTTLDASACMQSNTSHRRCWLAEPCWRADCENCGVCVGR